MTAKPCNDLVGACCMEQRLHGRRGLFFLPRQFGFTVKFPAPCHQLGQIVFSQEHGQLLLLIFGETDRPDLSIDDYMISEATYIQMFPCRCFPKATARHSLSMAGSASGSRIASCKAVEAIREDGLPL
ncbi:hypothetical protein [Bradyrhizobium sp. CCBAU 051011]|uniref:hypothetical protein n=1 Tax=Bradyrhizobium sp. CCBAU 051011 TaxID=858422 RepID=UPI001FF00C76|nr:hypothetical protein [Bradyrhizobium sp. CCBAU 051011]